MGNMSDNLSILIKPFLATIFRIQKFESHFCPVCIHLFVSFCTLAKLILHKVTDKYNDK